MRKLVTIREIEEIKPIEGADKICAYRVGGWWVVDQINKYKVGELAVYFEIDSWVPTTIAPFLSKDRVPREYNGVRGERLRTIKLRGQYSQGLLMNLSLIGEWDIENNEDLAELLNVQKWEAPENSSGNPRGSWPALLKHTDQERAQNLGRDIFVTNKDTCYEVTMKLDGSSMSVYFDGEEAGVCSRKVNLKLDNEGNQFIDTERKYEMIKKLKSIGRELAFQGELMGPGIQGNKENLKEKVFFLFDIWDMDNQCYLPPEERMEMIGYFTEMFNCMFEHVPLLHWNVTLADLGITNMEELISFADGPSINNNLREGLVFKSMDGKFTWKIISNKFLGKEK
jgi:RNA ligase (TIGR02306 family)